VRGGADAIALTTPTSFIRGELVPFNDRHTRLYEEFRARPSQRR